MVLAWALLVQDPLVMKAKVMSARVWELFLTEPSSKEYTILCPPGAEQCWTTET